MTAVPPTVTLAYNIAGCSEHSGRYVAENIMIDSPKDQTSRWSGAHQTSEVQQWILLRLDSIAIIKSIKFGKFHKRHPCNMKEFKIYIGLTEDNLTEVLHGSLKDDALPETFSIRSVTHSGIALPSRYMKIEPVSAHGQHFHTSIWFVALSGISDEAYVERVRQEYEEYQERVVLRHVLKHLRRRRFLQPFQSILSRSGLQLEHHLVTTLHTALVLQGDFSLAESLIPSLASAGLFSGSLLAAQPYASWTRIHAVDADGDIPSARGGHSMCIDPHDGKVYLFGGWDGQKNLDDFWIYDIKKDSWGLTQRSTSKDRHGPGPRSCHKIVFDSATGSIYLLGKLDDTDTTQSSRATPEIASPRANGSRPTSVPPALAPAPASGTSSHAAEFYRYHTKFAAGRWELISPDTTAVGGPPLIFDHQMAIDSEARVVYVSGGRVIDGDLDTIKYSGLYAYNIRTNEWKTFHSSDPSTHPSIPSRYGHSMVLDSKLQTLFIFGGQRDEQYLSDMYAFHIPTNTVTELFSNFTVAGGPDACFTQRAVIDPELREIYIFCGLTRHRPGSSRTILESESPYWIYRYERPEQPGTWTRILPHDPPFVGGSPSVSPRSSVSEPPRPVPRYAHQIVYDPTTKTIFMHGGNASLDGEVLMDTREQEGSARDRDRDRDRDQETPPTPMHIYREPEERREGAPEASTDSSATHLSDFWKMQLVRPSPDDIVRRCRYIIRQQKFRELCAEAPPIKALTYLQTEVSAVVDHSDPEETRVFRSLLSYLLTPPNQGMAQAPASEEKEPAHHASPKRSYTPEEGSPMKVTPTESETEADPEGQPEEDDTMNEAPVSTASEEATVSEHSVAAPAVTQTVRSVINMDEDPVERELNNGKTLSAERYKERTAVFEQLMGFVNEDAKQPDKDLLRMINIDQGDF